MHGQRRASIVLLRSNGGTRRGADFGIRGKEGRLAALRRISSNVLAMSVARWKYPGRAGERGGEGYSPKPLIGKSLA
jgi:hypothetical protein